MIKVVATAIAEPSQLTMSFLQSPIIRDTSVRAATNRASISRLMAANLESNSRLDAVKPEYVSLHPTVKSALVPRRSEASDDSSVWTVNARSDLVARWMLSRVPSNRLPPAPCPSAR